MEGFRGTEREGGGGRSRQARAKGEAGRDRRGRRQATAEGFCGSQRAVEAGQGRHRQRQATAEGFCNLQGGRACLQAAA